MFTGSKAIIKTGLILLTVASTVFLSCQRPINKVPVDNQQPSNLPERTILDTAYGADPRNKMDIYLPAGRNNTTKTVVMIHGGGWVGGDKKDMKFAVDLFKAKWPQAAFVSINYRYANGSTVTCDPILSDIHAAITLVVNNRSKFQVSDQVALLGASAGAHLALMYAYTQNQKGHVKCVVDLFGPSTLNDWQWYNAVFPLNYKDLLTKINGTTWNEPIYKNNSPNFRAHKDAPPTIIFHGTLDPVVPLYQSQWLRGRLNELKVPNEYYEYLDFHGFTMENYNDCADKCIRFFKQYMK